jgi:hypothetical protein
MAANSSEEMIRIRDCPSFVDKPVKIRGQVVNKRVQG